MTKSFNILFSLVIAIIVIGQRAEAVASGPAYSDKAPLCRNDKSLLKVCKEKYTVSVDCANLFLQAIFEKGNFKKIGFHCCKQLVVKEGRICHDRFVEEVIKTRNLIENESFYRKLSTKAWRQCADVVVLSN
ncbi:hypothetical protein ACFE04_010768 [Oxalis oulophora]